MRSTRLRIGVALAVCAVAALGLSAALAAGASQRPAAVLGSGTASATKSVCGLGTGKKATGKPILLEGIFTLVPGIDFTTIGKVAKAYFDCVNDNGGINGQRINYKLYTETLDPGKVAALAKKIVEQDKAIGVVGNTSLIDCPVNHKYYESKGVYAIIAGVPGECFGTPNIAAVNMGPRYSNMGAADAMIKQGKIKGTLVVSSPSAGGIAAYANGGVCLVAKAAGLNCISDAEDLPLQDTNATILKLVQQAGPGGGVIMDYTAETATGLLQAAGQQGVVDKVVWGQSTPVANEATAKVGSANGFDGKIYIGQEFNNLFTGKPDQTLYEQLTKKTGIPAQAFGQMGFLVGKFVTNALLSIKGPITFKSYNAAVVNLKNQKTDILCKPWYFWKLKEHLPNNTLPTVTYKDGKVVYTRGCTPVPAVDPLVVRARAAEKRFKLNTG
jgi:branched-chain amino acid transport system substrate-binding protein